MGARPVVDAGPAKIAVVAFRPGNDRWHLARSRQLFRPEYVMGRPERSGEALAGAALGAFTPPTGRIYTSLVKGEPTFPNPSELARSRAAQDHVWRESASLVGLA
jgi:hypothetical protein